MTLNQILNRVRLIALSHKQVRNFQKGLVTDFLTDHTTKYPSVFLQSNGGSISTARHQATLAYRMFIVDLVHVSKDTKQNEDDVLSDMLSIAMDLVAQMNSGDYGDWRLSVDNNLQEIVEGGDDLFAGWVMDFSISMIFTQDICQVPSDLVIEAISNTDIKMYYYNYIATGTEGVTLTIPTILGKYLVAAGREGSIIFQVSNLPDSLEYTWNNTTVTLGVPANPGERFLFVYRNY